MLINAKDQIPLVIYHGNCMDGFTAAWVIWREHKHWEFHPSAYSDPPPDVKDREVYMVDIAYKKSVIEQMAKEAKSITIIDHHKTAQKHLVNLPSNVTVEFDMHHCGCVLAWKHFRSDPVPEILHLVEDRDLWQYKFNSTKDLHFALSSYPYNFVIWDTLFTKRDLTELIKEGAHVHRYHMKIVNDLIQDWYAHPTYLHFKMEPGMVPMAVANHIFASDLAGALCHKHPFAVVMYMENGLVNYSLRSEMNGRDVSEIAEAFGGGGHQHAAAFQVESALHMNEPN